MTISELLKRIDDTLTLVESDLKSGDVKSLDKRIGLMKNDMFSVMMFTDRLIELVNRINPELLISIGNPEQLLGSPQRQIERFTLHGFDLE